MCGTNRENERRSFESQDRIRKKSIAKGQIQTTSRDTESTRPLEIQIREAAAILDRARHSLDQSSLDAFRLLEIELMRKNNGKSRTVNQLRISIGRAIEHLEKTHDYRTQPALDVLKDALDQ